MTSRKSWAEKLSGSDHHQVLPAPGGIAGLQAGEPMLVPSARLIDAFIRAIPAGQSMDVVTLRRQLARQYEAREACPITTGFLIRAVAEAAFEAYSRGTDPRELTPVWRVLDARTPVIKTLSYDPAFIFDRRRSEGLSP